MTEDADKTVETFNSKVAELLKSVKPEDLVTLFTHQRSLIAPMDNQNQNTRAPGYSS
jgi:hypothetical protein